MIQECVLVGFFAICSMEDIKERQIKISVLILFGIAGLLIHLLTFDQSIFEMVGGILVGVVVMVISKVTRESIGMGDAILLTVTGAYLGMEKNIQLLFYGLLFASIGALILIVFGKRSKKDDIPFVPFLFAGYFVVLLLYHGGIS